MDWKEFFKSTKWQVMLSVVLIILIIIFKPKISETDICRVEMDNTYLFYSSEEVNFFIPKNETKLDNETINFQRGFFRFFENVTSIKLKDKPFNIYYLSNLSACCVYCPEGKGECKTLFCTKDALNSAYYGYSGLSMLDIHEPTHLIFKNSLELPFWFEETFTDKMGNLYEYYLGQDYDSFKRFFNCNESADWVEKCSKVESYFIEGFDDRGAHCLIRKIDCDFSFDNSTLKFKNWIKFIKTIHSKGGIKSDEELYATLNSVYPGINISIAKLGLLNISSYPS